MEAWRLMTANERQDYLNWLEDTALDRWLGGEIKYHSDILGFQGDPLEHAIEEAFDILCYLWYLKRKGELGPSMVPSVPGGDGPADWSANSLVEPVGLPEMSEAEQAGFSPLH